MGESEASQKRWVRRVFLAREVVLFRGVSVRGQEASGSPGVESQQLGVQEQEGVQGLFASPCRAGVDSLDDMLLQRLYAQLTELRVDQPLHSLTTGGQGEEATSLTTLSCSMPWLVGTFILSTPCARNLGMGRLRPA